MLYFASFYNQNIFSSNVHVFWIQLFVTFISLFERTNFYNLFDFYWHTLFNIIEINFKLINKTNRLAFKSI